MFDANKTTETWYSPSDEIEAEYSVETHQYGGHYGDLYVEVPETQVEICGVSVMGIELPIADLPLLVAKLKEEIKESLQ